MFCKIKIQNIITHILCRDPSLRETRGTHLTVTRGTHYHLDRHHPDFSKNTYGALLLSGLPQGRANDAYKA